MQGGRHVDAGVVVVAALEADIARRPVGADALEEGRETHAAPLADRAPALDADVARHLVGLRQGVQFIERPAVPVGDHSADLEPEVRRIHDRDALFLVVGVERERSRDHRLGVGRGQPVRVEESGLHPVVPARNTAQESVGRRIRTGRAAGEETQAPQRQRGAEEAAPGGRGEQPLRIGQQQGTVRARERSFHVEPPVSCTIAPAIGRAASCAGISVPARP